MKTVSLDIAKRLKEAGLQWEPHIGDWLVCRQQELLVLQVKNHDLFVASDLQRFIIYEYPEVSFAWLPTLSDLLEWLEERGYTAISKSDKCELWKKLNVHITALVHFVRANTREDAAGEAIIWELRREKEAKHENMD